jgi:uncharacterized membrane protein YraQ (UPF0718 family)
MMPPQLTVSFTPTSPVGPKRAYQHACFYAALGGCMLPVCSRLNVGSALVLASMGVGLELSRWVR